MTGKTHRIIGLASGLTLLVLSTKPDYSPATFGAVLVGSYLGSLLPDLDEPAADIWDVLPFGHSFGEMVDPFFKHRNISHSIIGLGVVGFFTHTLLGSFPDYWSINRYLVLSSFLAAYASHLLADMLTMEGIPLFYPWRRMLGIPPRPLEGIRIMTGKWFENLIIFPTVNLWLILTIWINWAKIKDILFK